jgi:glycosyltransferase involved in cell wall biosynthesis
MSAATVSILITYHNERTLLTECLNSIQRQTAPIEEVIVYDDASTMPARDYLPTGLDVRVIRGEHNIGPSRGRNILLNEARGEFVHFHDADDLFDADWCKFVLAAIHETNPDVVITEVRSTSDGIEVCDRVLGMKAEEVRKDFLRCAIRGAFLVPSCTYRKALAEQIGGYRYDLWQSEDYDFHIRLAAQRPKVTMLDRALVTIRLRPGSRSQNRYEVVRDGLRSLEDLAKELPEPYTQELAERAFVAAVQLYRLGAHGESREAVQLAKRLSKLKYIHASPGQAFLYSVLPLPVAEALRSGYRRILPVRWRKLVREWDRVETI